MASELNQVPTSLVPIGTFGSNQAPVTVSNPWYLFFQSLSSLIVDLVGGVLGFTVQNGAEATGNSQATALQMTTEWIEVTVTPVGSGVALRPFGPGVASSVFNRGANALNIYPPVGGTIDTRAVNAPYPLPVGKVQVFSQVEDTLFLSMQLG